MYGYLDYLGSETTICGWVQLNYSRIFSVLPITIKVREYYWRQDWKIQILSRILLLISTVKIILFLFLKTK
jgi:hypothetical protein